MAQKTYLPPPEIQQRSLLMLINEKFLELPDFQKFCTDQYCFQIFFISVNLYRQV